MSITPTQKASTLVAILLIAGGAAFVYFDPMNLDLLGMNPPSAVQTAPRVAAPKPVVTLVQAKPLVAPVALLKAPPAPPPVVVAVPVVVPAPTRQPEMKMETKTVIKPTMKTTAIKTDSKPDRPKNLDLRHCLELETDAAIAKCAGE